MRQRQRFEGHLWLGGLTPLDGKPMAEKIPWPVTTIGGALEVLNARYSAMVVVWETLDGVSHVQLFPRRTTGKLHLDLAISLTGLSLFNILYDACLKCWLLKEAKCTPRVERLERTWYVP